MAFSATSKQYFTDIVAVSFIGEGNRSIRRNPPTCVLTYDFRYTIKLIMADVGQTGVSWEQSRCCLVLIQI
jgi:hypothetical protein